METHEEEEVMEMLIERAYIFGYNRGLERYRDPNDLIPVLPEDSIFTSTEELERIKRKMRAQVKKSFESGADEGYKGGYNDGCDDGDRAGREIGYDEGLALGREIGYRAREDYERGL